MRTFVSSLAALVMVAGIAVAQDEKAKPKLKNVMGKVESYDGTTLKVYVVTGRGQDAKTDENTTSFKVTDETPSIARAPRGGAQPEKKKVADIKDKIKKDARVRITVDADGKVTSVSIATAGRRGGRGQPPPK